MDILVTLPARFLAKSNAERALNNKKQISVTFSINEILTGSH